MATHDHIETWVNPAAWDDPAEAEAVVDAILASGTDDEATWVALAGGSLADVAAARERTFERDDPWTVTEVAEHLGVAASTVRAYTARGQMPPPDGRLGRTPWWLAGTIRAWRPRA